MQTDKATRNERGRRVGEAHPKAVLRDWEVEVLLDLRDAGWGYTRLARHFDVSRRSVRDICSLRYRAQAATRR